MEIEKSLTKKQKLKLSISNYVSYYYNSTKPVLQKKQSLFFWCMSCVVLSLLRCSKNPVWQKPSHLAKTNLSHFYGKENCDLLNNYTMTQIATQIETKTK